VKLKFYFFTPTFADSHKTPSTFSLSSSELLLLFIVIVFLSSSVQLLQTNLLKKFTDLRQSQEKMKKS